MSQTVRFIVLLVCGLPVAVLQGQSSSGARLRAGSVPELPATAVSGGEVFVDLAVTSEGRVSAATPLRAVEPFTEGALAAVRRWEFGPADEAGRSVPSHVLAAMLFRPPTVYAVGPGGNASDLSPAPEEMPFPITTVTPTFPPLAHGSGVVLIEVLVAASGVVADAQVIRSAPPFDEPALAAARRWLFRPARPGGSPAPRFAYLVFGFPAPVLVPPSPRPPGGVR
jgi:TonB family protein